MLLNYLKLVVIEQGSRKRMLLLSRAEGITSGPLLLVQWIWLMWVAEYLVLCGIFWAQYEHSASIHLSILSYWITGNEQWKSPLDLFFLTEVFQFLQKNVRYTKKKSKKSSCKNKNRKIQKDLSLYQKYRNSPYLTS